jgi:hypothetical protein
MELFESDRIEDAVSDAQAACLAVSGDVVRADAQSSGYADMSRAINDGLDILKRLISSRGEGP